MPRFISRGSATLVDDFTESRTRGVGWRCAVGNPGTLGPNEQKIKPIESISIFSVHFILNLPQASRLLGMTKGRRLTFLMLLLL
jgi:hypothetical protein